MQDVNMPPDVVVKVQQPDANALLWHDVGCFTVLSHPRTLHAPHACDSTSTMQ
jgi:hypothetical protein